MGDCKYCGKPAGLLKKSHKECKASFEWGRKEIAKLIGAAVGGQSQIAQLRSSVEHVARKTLVPGDELRGITIDSWCQAVETAFDDGILTVDEETALLEIQKQFDFGKDELDKNGTFTRIVKGGILRDVLEGKLPERVTVQGSMPFNFLKNERLVWLFQGVRYLEQRVRRHYEGGSTGVSFRVAKGVYLRTSAFRGHPVETAETVHADTGLLAFTDKHIYFSGPAKSFRVPYKKIVSFEPFSDGIGIQRDAASAKPQTFVTGDGWFSYNLAANLSRMS